MELKLTTPTGLYNLFLAFMVAIEVAIGVVELAKYFGLI